MNIAKPGCMTLLVSSCFLKYSRVQGEVLSLCVYKGNNDWLQLHTWRERYDSINTLVMFCATSAFTIPIGDHALFVYLRYPVFYN